MQNGKPGGEVAEEKNNEEAEERGDATLKREVSQLEYLQIHDSVAEVLQKMTNIAGK
ncbi:hypothetical protein VIGAN_09194700 [Vigna angularis var. angularis]|uniref:Uncharacterized protein n=1 Tax=Vigna angularis var. angularis TaxID=157739 RepID=A0A0S3SZG6_PHAAN|nr:hypothetical protein VIGAN_09194700 [Vigna angularis var. angularis]